MGYGHCPEKWVHPIATFLRSASELEEIANYHPFTTSELSVSNSLYIAFLQSPPTAEAEQKLMAFQSEIEDFHVHEREIYWLCQKTMSKSSFSGALLEKTIEMPATMRNATTVKRLAAKYPASE